MIRRKYLGFCLSSAIIISSTMLVRIMLMQRQETLNADPIMIPAASPEIKDNVTFQPTVQYPPPRASLSGPFFHQGRTLHAFLNISEDTRAPRCRPPTPLFVPFMSHFCLLQQTVLSYIVEGWARFIDDRRRRQHWHINSQPTRATSHPDDHAFLNHPLLLRGYGINIYRSPTRRAFSQTQNLLIQLASKQEWPSFYQSHQDVIVRHHREFDRGVTIHSTRESWRNRMKGLQKLPQNWQ